VLIAVFPVTYYVTHPLMDYRQPIEPAIIVLAVSGSLSWRRIPISNSGVQLKPHPDFWIGPEVAAEPLLPSGGLSK
jgi:hypothetical protein